jgi:malonyl-CoA O-methyltransferase
LIGLLPESSPELVLDLGCGTGFFSRHLRETFPQAKVVGLDLAEGMAQHASQHQQADNWLCGDAENLPLKDQCVDIIFSSLAIQWCEDNNALFAEVFRVLKPGGHFVFSTLGPNTLFELRDAWSAVDNYVHVNRFVEKSVIGSAVATSGFSEQALKDGLLEEMIVLEYENLKQLTRELKSLGAHNVNNGRQTGLTGKQRIRGLIDAYEQRRNANNKLPASYQTWYGSLEKPQVIVDSVVKTQTKEQIVNGR